jgi:hypothetical protein
MKNLFPCLSAITTGAALLLLTGCNTVSVQTTAYVGVPNYPPTDPATVEILRQPPTAPNIRLGEITVEPQGNPTKEQIESKLQKAAAKLGANAVAIVADRTMVTGATVMGPWWGRSVTPDMGRVIIGVAIRYTTL